MNAPQRKIGSWSTWGTSATLAIHCYLRPYWCSLALLAQWTIISPLQFIRMSIPVTLLKHFPITLESIRVPLGKLIVRQSYCNNLWGICSLQTPGSSQRCDLVFMSWTVVWEKFDMLLMIRETTATGLAFAAQGSNCICYYYYRTSLNILFTIIPCFVELVSFPACLVAVHLAFLGRRRSGDKVSTLFKQLNTILIHKIPLLYNILQFVQHHWANIL